MKLISQRRLGYVFRNRTDTWISAQTGIPRSTVGFIRRGDRAASAANKGLIRNLYQREAYGRMREEGFSSIQAKRFSWYAPESVRLKESEMILTIDRLTEGVVAARKAKARKEGKPFDEDEERKKAKEQVKEGFRRSRKSVEDWQDY